MLKTHPPRQASFGRLGSCSQFLYHVHDSSRALPPHVHRYTRQGTGKAAWLNRCCPSSSCRCLGPSGGKLWQGSARQGQGRTPRSVELRPVGPTLTSKQPEARQQQQHRRQGHRLVGQILCLPGLPWASARCWRSGVCGLGRGLHRRPAFLCLRSWLRNRVCARSLLLH